MFQIFFLQKLTVVKSIIDAAMVEIAKRTPPTPAQLQNHDMHEYVAVSKKVQ
jgi:hypothetical protein